MGIKRYVVIMAGGVGSRFWPSSTEEKPKQFLDILGVGKSLLRITYERALKITSSGNVIVITNKVYYALVKQEIPELEDENILCEPSRNNTAPSVAYAALHIQARDKDASFVVLSSDHIILFEDKFTTAINQAFDFAEKYNALMTLGIQPSRPDTGYGYIELDDQNVDIKKVISFKEKPKLDIAAKYLDLGNYMWNAGIFIWKVECILEAFELYTEDILNHLNSNPSKYYTSLEQEYIDEVYPLTQKISVDYAIMEKATNVYCLPADIGWSDLGTWASLYSFSEKDMNNNVVHSDSNFLQDVKGCIIKVKEGKKAIIKGLNNCIVIDEDHALLIYPIENEQEIKEVVRKLS
jgi:mannose-1-phosphate guanylyltransferase